VIAASGNKQREVKEVLYEADPNETIDWGKVSEGDTGDNT
jgi:hypothetical protein